MMFLQGCPESPKESETILPSFPIMPAETEAWIRTHAAQCVDRQTEIETDPLACDGSNPTGKRVQAPGTQSLWQWLAALNILRLQLSPEAVPAN